MELKDSRENWEGAASVARSGMFINSPLAQPTFSSSSSLLLSSITTAYFKNFQLNSNPHVYRTSYCCTSLSYIFPHIKFNSNQTVINKMYFINVAAVALMSLVCNAMVQGAGKSRSCSDICDLDLFQDLDRLDMLTVLEKVPTTLLESLSQRLARSLMVSESPNLRDAFH